MAFEITWEPRGGVRTFSGMLTAEEFINSCEIVHNDWRFDPIYCSINDFLAVTNVELGELTTQTAAARAIGASMSKPRLLMASESSQNTLLQLVDVDEFRGFGTSLPSDFHEFRRFEKAPGPVQG